MSFEERSALVEQKLRDVGASLTVAKTRRLEKAAVYEQMRAATNPEELPDAIRSPLVQALRTELATLERQGAQLEAKGYLDEHPEVVRLRRQVEGTRQKIALEARRLVRAAQNEYDVAATQEASLGAALEAAKAEALDLSRRRSEYDALKRDVEASRKLSESVLARQKQTDVARDVKASNIHVIDPALAPTSPVRPRPVRDMGLALLLGLGGAVAAAFFRDYLDTSVGRPADVRHLGLPLLGIIPETAGKRGPLLMGNGHGKEPFFEGYRVLRTALHPPPQAGQAQVVLVTSTLAGEGKSLTSVNLALTLASTEERVLLIDADLRRPALHGLLNMRRSPGLSDVLTGVAGVAQAVVKAPGSRLFLLSCGSPFAGNPADLLATGTLRQLLARPAAALRPHRGGHSTRRGDRRRPHPRPPGRRRPRGGPLGQGGAERRGSPHRAPGQRAGPRPRSGAEPRPPRSRRLRLRPLVHARSLREREAARPASGRGPAGRFREAALKRHPGAPLVEAARPGHGVAPRFRPGLRRLRGAAPRPDRAQPSSPSRRSSTPQWRRSTRGRLRSLSTPWVRATRTARIASFVWNFGDGTPEETTTTSAVDDVFPDTASRCLEVTYGVSLQVVDEQGGRGVASLPVKVTELPAPTAQECQR